MVYPTLSEIEVGWRASGSGVCVIVEGETELEDAWFYNHWFGSLAREVTFFPQDGWERVVDAVTTLRPRLGARRVYGIVDRDFENVVYDPFPGDGILRTVKYTLENYLLDAGCWFQYVQPHTLRVPKPGWNSLDEARTTIEGLYEECLPLSAYNWVLRQACKLDNAAFKSLDDADRTYKEHPRAITAIGDVLAHLRDLQAQMNIPDDLGHQYTMRLADLEHMPLADLEQVVSGKYVMKLLRERFPLRIFGRQAWDDVLGAYISICPDPPADLATLIELILENAHS
jgi:hypothetical protein